MNLRNLFLSALMLGLVACSSGGGSGGGGAGSPGNTDASDGQFKQDLRMAAKSTPALTPEQKQKISSLFKKDAALLPSTDLYFDNYQNWNDRTKDMAALNDEGKNLLSRVQKDCTITPSRETTTGQAEVGQTLTKEKTKSINGTNCPISYSEKEVNSQTITNIDQQNRSGSSVNVVTADISARVLDAELQRKVFSTGHDLHNETRVNVNNYKVDESGKFISGNVYGTLNSSYTVFTSSGEKIMGTATGEIVMVPTTTKAQVLTNFRFPDGVVWSIALFIEGKNTEILVNGESYTKESFYETYGTWFKIPDLGNQTK